jgi:hypothetical protein
MLDTDRTFVFLLRLEGLLVLVLGTWTAAVFATNLWLVALFAVLPDLSILAYLFGPRVGARIYNVLHSYVAPGLLSGLGVALAPQLLPLACIWAAHIGFDRGLGYGLKATTGFRQTHLGQIGKRAHR